MKVGLKILNSGMILKTFPHAASAPECSAHLSVQKEYNKYNNATNRVPGLERVSFTDVVIT